MNTLEIVDDGLFYTQKRDAYTQIIVNHLLGKSFYTNKLMHAFLFFSVSSKSIKEYLNKYTDHDECIRFRAFIQTQLDLCITKKNLVLNEEDRDIWQEMKLFLKTSSTARNYQKPEFTQKKDEAYLALIDYTNECPTAAEIEIYNTFSHHKFKYEDQCIRYYHIAYEAEHAQLCLEH